MNDESIPACVLLYGSDTVRLDALRDDLNARIIDRYKERVSWEVFDDAREDISSYTARMATGSLFAPFRVFVLRNTPAFFEQHASTLDWILDASLAQSCCIVYADDTARTKKPRRGKGAFDTWVARMRQLEKKQPGLYRVHAYQKPRDYQLPEWLVSFAADTYGRNMRSDDAALLIDRAGTDLGTLRGELEKLDLMLDPATAITTEAIERVVDASRGASGFELAHALGKKDLTRAFEIIDGLFVHTFYAPLVLTALYRHFWQLFRIRLYARRHPEDIRTLQGKAGYARQNEAGFRVGVATGMLTEKQKNRVYPAVIKSGVVPQAMSFTRPHFESIFRQLHAYDKGIKTGAVQATKPTLQQLCYTLVLPQ
jgi:DNA polymerase III delta subunit